MTRAFCFHLSSEISLRLWPVAIALLAVYVASFPWRERKFRNGSAALSACPVSFVHWPLKRSSCVVSLFHVMLKVQIACSYSIYMMLYLDLYKEQYIRRRLGSQEPLEKLNQV